MTGIAPQFRHSDTNGFLTIPGRLKPAVIHVLDGIQRIGSGTIMRFKPRECEMPGNA